MWIAACDRWFNELIFLLANIQSLHLRCLLGFTIVSPIQTGSQINLGLVALIS